MKRYLLRLLLRLVEIFGALYAICLLAIMTKYLISWEIVWQLIPPVFVWTIIFGLLTVVLDIYSNLTTKKSGVGK